MGGCFSRKATRESRPRQEQQRPVFRAQHNGREKERPAERNGARRKTEPAKRPTPERKQSRIPAANLRENKSHSLPLGKRTNFGYEKTFKAKYTLGKLLGHGQFGYTYVAIEKSTGKKVAVKCIEKKQVPRNGLNFHFLDFITIKLTVRNPPMPGFRNWILCSGLYERCILCSTSNHVFSLQLMIDPIIKVQIIE